MPENVYDFIKSETTAFKTSTITLADGWDWNMYEHIRKSYLYKNSKFSLGPNDGERPFDNIILPILQVAYYSEDIDVKDIVPYVDDVKNYHKSFLVKKYHPRWARKNNLDTFIDEIIESYIDYGLALVKDVDGIRPEVVPLEKLAFCDQTDVLSGAVCIEHQYTPSELKKQTRWNQDEIERAITKLKEKARTKNTNLSVNNKESNTPTGYIKVYELHGEFPESWLKKDGDDDKYIRQMQVIVLDSDKDKSGITLYSGKEKNPFKTLKRDSIFGRACGRGGVEELFEPQTWCNYDAIQEKEMLDLASAMIMVTADKGLAARQKVTDLEKGELMYEDIEAKGTTRQLVIQPYNKTHFDNHAQKWENRARLIGSASQPALGQNPTSGTPLGTTQLVTSGGLGPHQKRQGQISTFIGEIYRDWIFGYLVKDINKGQKFLEELSFDELNELADKIAENYINKYAVERILSGDFSLDQEMLDREREKFKQNFAKGGSKKFIEIVKDEIKDIPIDVEVNVAGKQKDLAGMVNKLSNIVRMFISDPRFQTQDMANVLMQLFEDSGLSPINFASIGKVFTNTQPNTQSAGQPIPSPMQPQDLPVNQPTV